MRLFRRIGLYLSLATLWFAHAGRYYALLLTGSGRKDVQGVRMILVRNGDVVLIKHWYAPSVWTLPGGRVGRKESLEDAIKREVREETGFKVRSIDGVVGTYRGSLGERDVVRVYHTSDFEGFMSLVPILEVSIRAWFSIKDLPEEISPANRRRIEAYRDGVRGETGRW
ncbi:hypothetical protein A3A39_04155 [Candidatus Kaiserbacteria bacterium RIFCSPLOWO2_01_FULL_54_13]|uniref:Nudix hydrolase domain-containing protein n=1 Tax=Candidatus Kaiserbacteria bacterium RIFCSPLOWO2_01_FULL_54_13 TaxID=1798512 RepID=A0A1F6F3P7_9BACT|nr:MAG: hypothetical protein A3A39_04155 [Candidatus Kaiserbacteria bacterium RIFCSPLOWO2_01_FULL_54_13]